MDRFRNKNKKKDEIKKLDEKIKKRRGKMKQKLERKLRKGWKGKFCCFASHAENLLYQGYITSKLRSTINTDEGPNQGDFELEPYSTQYFD